MLQVPLALQVCTLLPEHCVAPGVHGGLPHAPLKQPSLQTAPVLQVPLALQVCTLLPEHCVAFGTHTPLRFAVHMMAASVSACPALVKTVGVVSVKKKQYGARARFARTSPPP